MALHLRKAVVHSTLINTAMVAAIGATAMLFSGGLNPERLVLIALLALSLGLLSGWLKMRSMARRVIAGIPAAATYARISRDHDFGQTNIEWHHLDDYAAQLLARGFTHLGDFTNYPLGRVLTGAVAIYLDRTGSTLVEIQYIRLAKAAPGTSKANGVHFSLISLIGGQIRVNTTDHTPIGTNFILRSPCDVLAAYPGENLMSLLDKHRRLLATVCERTGKAVSAGLSMARYMLYCRQRYDTVRNRLQQLSSYQLISEIDRFEATPLLNWAQPSAVLASLPLQSMAELDQTASLHPEPLIHDLSGDYSPPAAPDAPLLLTAKGDSVVLPGAQASGAADDQLLQDVPALLERVVGRAASWFYWIAGLSLVNLLAAVAGSTWNFSLGLGFSQLLYQQGKILQTLNAPVGGILVMYLGCIGSILFMAACGYFARKPSAFVFSVGMASVALDSVIFLLTGNYLAVLIHAVALFFLYRGLRGARLLRAMRESQAQAAA